MQTKSMSAASAAASVVPAMVKPGQIRATLAPPQSQPQSPPPPRLWIRNCDRNDYGDALELAALTGTLNLSVDPAGVLVPFEGPSLSAALEDAATRGLDVAITLWPYHSGHFSEHDPRRYANSAYWIDPGSFGSRLQDVARRCRESRARIVRVFAICEQFNSIDSRAVRLGIPSGEYREAVVDAIEYASVRLEAWFGPIVRWYGMNWQPVIAGPDNIAQRTNPAYVPPGRGSQASQACVIVDRPHLLDLSWHSIAATFVGKPDRTAWAFLTLAKSWQCDPFTKFWSHSDVPGDYMAHLPDLARALASIRGLTDVWAYSENPNFSADTMSLFYRSLKVFRDSLHAAPQAPRVLT